MAAFHAVYYRVPDGDEPVRAYLDALDDEVHAAQHLLQADRPDPALGDQHGPAALGRLQGANGRRPSEATAGSRARRPLTIGSQNC